MSHGIYSFPANPVTTHTLSVQICGSLYAKYEVAWSRFLLSKDYLLGKLEAVYLKKQVYNCAHEISGSGWWEETPWNDAGGGGDEAWPATLQES